MPWFKLRLEKHLNSQTYCRAPGSTQSPPYLGFLGVFTDQGQAHESATEARWVPVQEAQQLDLAFDHLQLLAAAHQRLKAQVEYTALPVHLMPEEFTLSDLQKVFEAILEKTLEKKSFRRRILDADILEETLNMRRAGSRPAQLYRIKDSEGGHFFSRNLEGKRHSK